MLRKGDFMYKRHPHNSNLVLQNASSYKDYLPVQSTCGLLVTNYLDRIDVTLSAALREYSRVCAIRFDLRFPSNYFSQDSSVISRFMESLSSRLEAEELRKRREGERVYPCRLRYMWVREKNSSLSWHYHVCIILNRDAYFTLGRFKLAASPKILGVLFADEPEIRKNMAARINGAWASALGMSVEQSKGLVEFPTRPVYHIDRNSRDWSQQHADLFYRLSYFAKAKTKFYGDGYNSFGCSRK